MACPTAARVAFRRQWILSYGPGQDPGSIRSPTSPRPIAVRAFRPHFLHSTQVLDRLASSYSCSSTNPESKLKCSPFRRGACRTIGWWPAASRAESSAANLCCRRLLAASCRSWAEEANLDKNSSRMSTSGHSFPIRRLFNGRVQRPTARCSILRSPRLRSDLPTLT